MKNIEEILNKFKFGGLSDSEKSVLWSQIEGRLGEHKRLKVKVPVVFGLSARLVTSLALVITLLVGGSAFTVSAANASVPGDFLFPADEFIENMGVAFAFGENENLRRIEIANERLAEAQIVVEEARVHASGSDDIREVCVLAPDLVLNVALGRLEGIRNRLLEDGSLEAVATIDATINELLGLAVRHTAHLGEVDEEIEISEEDTAREEALELREQIRESRKEIEFKFDHIVVDDFEGELGGASGENATSGRSLGTRFDVEEQEWKAYLCHESSGGSYTIAVGSPAAERSHIAHGDTEGACETGTSDVRGASTETEDGEGRNSNDNGRGSRP